MDDLSNLERFSINFLSTKDNIWLNLFFFEYYRDVENQEEKENQITAFSQSYSFKLLAKHLPDILLRAFFFTAEGENLNSKNHNDSRNRNFLLKDIGCKVVLLLSDLNLEFANLTNEDSFVEVLIDMFPFEKWEENLTDIKLVMPTEHDIKLILKMAQFPMSEHKQENKYVCQLDLKDVPILYNGENVDYSDLEQYTNDEFREFNDSFCLTSPELAMKILTVLCKFVSVDNLIVINKGCVTMVSLSFGIRALSEFQQHEQNITFTDNDQSVIMMKLLELIVLCFNNIIKCESDAFNIDQEFESLLNLLNVSKNMDIVMTLLNCILSITGHFSEKKVSCKINIMSELRKNKNMVLEKIGLFKNNTERLFSIQKRIIKIICTITNSNQMKLRKKGKPIRKLKDDSLLHHRKLKDVCIFERLLIDSLKFVTKYRHLSTILKYLRINGVCCCCSDLSSIKYFMRSSTISYYNLYFIERKLMGIMFNRKCSHCNEQLKSESFQNEYFAVLNYEIQRREGYEFHLLLYHLTKINQIMTKKFQEQFIKKLIVPIFIKNKISYLNDAENNYNLKYILQCCLEILSQSTKNNLVLEDIFTKDFVNHLRDCSLMPHLSSNVCTILRFGIETVKDNKLEIAQQIKTILFANLHLLISEIIDIYEQIGLPKNCIMTENNTSSDMKNESIDFEILNEQVVIVKENLSNLDILLLNAIHWRIIFDLIITNSSFQNDFISNICNNFNGNVVFSIAQQALNSMLLKKESSAMRPVQNYSKSESKITNFYERCDYLLPIFIQNYDINYGLILYRSYDLFEICQNFVDNLNKNDDDESGIENISFTMIYSTKRDKRAKFKKATIHRDNFLTENVEEYLIKENVLEKGQTHFSSSTYHQWFNTFKMGISMLESKNIKDVFVGIANKFFQPDKELHAIYRANTIQEITSNYGLRYLFLIARNCFDICSCMTDNKKFNTRMSVAFEELKLLLLQDDIVDDNNEALIESLQFLLSVAELKSSSINQHILTNLENHLTTESIFSIEDFYLCNNERIVFHDSDDEEEEDRKTENYFTADENYDGDEEYFSMKADDTDCSHSSYKTPSSATTFLNLKNTNEHICNLVVEVLMDITKRSLKNRDLYNPEKLTALAKRLNCSKEFLGGSLFLLKGFSPLFEENSTEFESLQRSILKLIDNLNTPETFSVLFTLLANKNAPAKLLISRIEEICNQQLGLTAFSGVQYPIYSMEATIKSTCDTYIHQRIRSYRDEHLNHKLLTPFTEASQIIPLNFLNIKIWESEGYTISTWINMQANINEKSTIHFLSLGTDKLLLAVFLNEDGSLNFNLMKPNQILDLERENQKANKLLIDNQAQARATKYSSISDKENINETNLFGIGSAVVGDVKIPNIITRNSIKNGMKKSKQDETNRRLKTSKVCTTSKKRRVKCNKWTHICLSFKKVDYELIILLTINGTEHETIEIPINEMIDHDSNGFLQLLFVGAHKLQTDEKEISQKYTMSNLLLFRSPLDTSLITYLFSLGPDCDNFVDCEVKQIIPLKEYINLNTLTNISSSKNGMYDLVQLQYHLILSYSIGKTNFATAYIDKKSEHGKTLDIFTIGPIPNATIIDSIQRSVYCLGGLSSLLFLFARTVELTENSEAQSSALFIFLKVAYSNNYLYAEFEQKRMFNLVAHVFKHGNCYRGAGMLKSILDVIYGGSIFLNRSGNDNFEINGKSELNIQNPSLLMKLMNHFDIFLTQDDEMGNLDLLFKSLMTVVRDSHPYKCINRQCLINNGFFERIIEFCKIHFGTTGSSKVTISHSTALILVDLLKMLTKNSVTIWNLNEISKLLMILHRPNESFITHDRSKMSFTLSNQKPSKSKSNSIISSKYFNFSTKIRSPILSLSITSSPSNSYKSGISNNTPPSKSPRLSASIDGSFPFNETESKVSKNINNSVVLKNFKMKRLDELSENQILKITNALKEIKTPTKTPRKRLKSTPRNSSSYRNTSTPFKKHKRRNIIDSEDIDEKLIEKFETLMSSSNLNLTENENDHLQSGINVLQEHLFLMLRNAMLHLDNVCFQNELPECFKIEPFIMFANHYDPNVRAAIINLIHVITNRVSNDIINSYYKLNYWIHLGNQLSISPINLKMLQACIDWICLEKISISEVMRAQEIKLKFKPAFRVLIAMLPSMTHDVQLLKCSSKFLRLIMETQNDCFYFLIENGLITSCIKTLMKISNESSIDPIQLILEQIAMKSFTTTNMMQVLWELLYDLVYAERLNKNEVIKHIHMAILKQLLATCLTEEIRRGSRNESVRPNLMIIKILGNLSSSEIKTRFNLIHDRAIQFLLSWENINEMNANELDFVKYLIDLYYSGITQQGTTLILWSLKPSCCDEIKLFSAQRIIAALQMDSNFSISEPKILKSLLTYLSKTNSTSFSEEQVKVIMKYCGTSSSQQQQNMNWSMTAIEKIESICQNATKDQLHQVDKFIYKLEPLVQTCIDSAMRMTRDVVDRQNKERRKLINQLKKTQEIDFYREWFELIQRMIHEGAPWYNENLYPSTFELDDTEGPDRSRIRLKRSFLEIEERFYMNEFKYKAQYQRSKQLLNYLLYPKETERYSIRDQIIFTFNGKHLTMEQEIDGEVIITDNQLIFLASQDAYNNSIICNISDIEEIWNRRYQHKEIAMEVFLKSSKNFFIIFESNYERDIVNTFMADKIESEKSNQKIEVITQKWSENKMTNYEYLIQLNKISGRSYNDLMQYPVFPWVIVKYDSDILDLTSPETFRKLNKTISTQYENAEEHYVTNYRYLMEQMSDQSIMKPYHYSSHYSNSGTVLHFLVRLPPFTNMFLLYQDHNFDIPDRTFHSMATTFRLTSKESATDVKELLPEFYNLPDFLENREGFNYGKRQSGEQVNHVKLPEWCENSSRLFMLIHRQALESDYVRKNLHQWIDLIFGFKQKGKAAIEAVNVFHPATYPEFQMTGIIDQVERSAYETMVRTYGQMPKQIFSSPHKKALTNDKNNESPYYILKSVKGLKHGLYTGSLQLPKPKKMTSTSPIFCKQKDSKLVHAQKNNQFFVVPASSSLMKSSLPDTYDLVLWKQFDGIIRTKPLTERHSRKLFCVPSFDPITCCGTDINYSNIWFGHLSGNISVYMRTDIKQQIKKSERIEKTANATLQAILDIGIQDSNKMSNNHNIQSTKSVWHYPIILLRHQGQVVNIRISTNFKIVVSIGIDGRTVIWDSQKIEYIQTIETSCNALKTCLTHVDISPTLGDILTVFKPKNDEIQDDDECFEITENNGDDFINVSIASSGKSQLRLHNINGKYINHIFLEGIITAVCFSYIKEGTGVNVIAVALNDGSVRLYSTWNLSMLREIATGCDTIIKEIAFSVNQYLVLLTENEIHLWGSEGLSSSERPNFHDIVFVN